jgi:regulator of replication initiation timing
VHSQSPILETTPLYTTILTEVLDRIMAENRSMKLENRGLRKMIAKLQAGEDILGSDD